MSRLAARVKKKFNEDNSIYFSYPPFNNMNNEKIEIPEKEENFQVREFINLASIKKKTERGTKVSELIDQRAENSIPPLPEPLKAMIMDDYLKIRALTDDENVLMAAVEVSYKRIICGYERRVTDNEKMPNEAYARLNAMEKIDALFCKEKDPNPEDFKKIAYATFDLNGLKAVNDYNSHDNKKGDMYLLLAAKAISSSDAIEYAEKNGINFEPGKVTRDGGDEFSAIITSDKPLTKEVLEGFVLAVQASLWNNPDIAKLLDFNNPEVLAHHTGVPVSEIGNDIEGFKLSHGIPSNYKYHGAMSGGAVTLHDALANKDIDEKNKINSADQYPQMLQKIMGAMFSLGGKKMDSDKKRFKEGLASVTAEEVIKEFAAKGIKVSKEQAGEEALHRRTLAEVYSRTDAEKELTQKNAKLEAEICELKEKKEYLSAQISMVNEILKSAIGENNWELVKNAQKLLEKIDKEK